MTRHLLVALAVSLPLGLAACNSEPTEAEVETWVRAQNLPKLAALVGSAERKFDLRVRAVELLAETGQLAALKSVLEGVKDREAVVGGVAEKIVAALKETGGDLKAQVKSKDALFGVLSYLDDKTQDEALKAVAEWAFAGLNEKTDKAYLIQRLQDTDMSLHLTMLRSYGVKVAAWLVAFGIETRRLIPSFREAKDRDSQRVVVAAVRKLFAMKNLVVPWEAMDAVLTYGVPDTIDLLLDVYLNDAFGGDRQGSAIGMAQRLIYGKVEGVDILKTPEDRAAVLKALQRLMASTRATDRWDAADMIVRVGGVEKLGAVLDGFKDNIGSYARYTPDGSIELPDYAINEFCTDKLRPKADVARPILEARLVDGDGVQKAFSVLCLKVLADARSVEKLQPLTTDTMSLEVLFFVKEERDKRRAQIQAKEIPELTLGLLALNAMDGIALIGELQKEKEAGTLKEDDYKLRIESVMSVISAAGEAFRPAVKQVYQKKSKTPWDPPAPTPVPAPEANPGKKKGK